VSFDGVWLRATAGDDRVRCLEVTPEAVEQDLIRRPAAPGRSPVLVEGGFLAYLTVTREGIDPDRRARSRSVQLRAGRGVRTWPTISSPTSTPGAPPAWR
jgi:hypothetical protein